ncbi:uncharacterized protein LOC124336525 isoform X2 [Daphnia pulicaria]|uniref:uncharacterized protein LOC124336525 isoform X2 n=1 Tax=Daphnia pulicaria TaxID=35523 RepID=UPI001EEAF47A|nr:uncharacterized protein LOC124336525 isoform X2 [Daphnia pulicaria]
MPSLPCASTFSNKLKKGNNVSFNLHLAKSSDRGPETSVMLLCIFLKFRPLLGMAVRLIPYMETSGRNRSGDRHGSHNQTRQCRMTVMDDEAVNTCTYISTLRLIRLKMQLLSAKELSARLS